MLIASTVSDYCVVYTGWVAMNHLSETTVVMLKYINVSSSVNMSSMKTIGKISHCQPEM